jgi:phage shock protein A
MGDREVRIGTALRRMAEDLVAARRRVADLERENRRLRARLATVERQEDEMQSSRSRTEEPSRT